MKALAQDTAAADTGLALTRQDSGASGPVSVFRFEDEEANDNMPEADTVPVSEEIPQGPGLFKGHLLQPVHPTAQPFSQPVSDWFTLTLLALVGVFTWFRLFYYKIFKQLFGAFFNITTTNQIVRDESVLLQRASLILSIVSYLLMGLFLYQVSVYRQWEMGLLQSGLLRFTLLSVMIAIAYSGKMILLRFLSAVFDLEKAVAQYIFNIFLMVMMIGILLLPVNILLAYAPALIREWTIYLATGVIGLLFLYRLVRAVGIWTGIPGFSLFYLFLYLCTFEIAPLLIIWKLTFGAA